MHIPVLLHEIINDLDFKDGDIFLDATIGFGGHVKGALLTGKKLKIIGIDLDENALSHTKNLLEEIKADYVLSNESFRNLDKVLEEEEVSCANKILFDLGVSSFEIEKSGRGFSFMRDEPLQMTLSSRPEEAEFTAETIVNEWGEESIADIIFGYGEDRFARRIAKAIVTAREEKPIKTTFELKEIVFRAVPSFARRGKIHPATKTFQAIRIAVNDELGALREGLRKGFDHLCPTGRIAVISFHSLEDRIVKRFFKGLEEEGVGKNLYKKPLVAKDEERTKNPRSRSAKLRVFQKN